MTKLKSPPRDVAPIRLQSAPRAIVSSSAPAPLTAEERRLLDHWRSADDTRREHLEVMAEAFGTKFPRREAPTLKLVPGGAS
jgi:hypothetical protein